jgi:hypothetical protein
MTWEDTLTLLMALDEACHEYECNKIRELLKVPAGYLAAKEKPMEFPAEIIEQNRASAEQTRTSAKLKLIS